MDIRPNIIDLKFRKPEEVVTLLCERLRKERLYLEMTQADVATRAGISANTVSNQEAVYRDWETGPKSYCIVSLIVADPSHLS